jgi:hypothetical protein
MRYYLAYHIYTPPSALRLSIVAETTTTSVMANISAITPEKVILRFEYPQTQ